ncbi:hypothetical protein PR001_g23287 [Phytophthora rubi]|uniref:Uncharacterized protein n=1 Tax=Phytophthora rubi TaxID=129364 RepID=A0A6A3IXD0_9STRA|nr:hypothetical protein PR002_g23687 [Phytophthora rubi]KAE8984023.1 hypothetical protein PR001_g23287 [Phytophthora rubi]
MPHPPSPPSTPHAVASTTVATPTSPPRPSIPGPGLRAQVAAVARVALKRPYRQEEPRRRRPLRGSAPDATPGAPLASSRDPRLKSICPSVPPPNPHFRADDTSAPSAPADLASRIMAAVSRRHQRPRLRS